MNGARELTANAVRTDVVKWRVGQALVPISTVVSVFARRTMEPPVLAVAAVLLATTGILLWSARRPFRGCALRVLGDCVRLGDHDAELNRSEFRAWTLEAGVARLYSPSTGWRLSVSASETEALHQLLRPIFGAPLVLRRRGSQQGRQIAGAVAIVGAVLVSTSIAFELVPLVLVGVPALIFGLAALGALSQKVTTGGA